jgi:hypothetical protein
VLKVAGRNDVTPIPILDPLTIFHDHRVTKPGIPQAQIHWRMSPTGLIEAKWFATGATLDLTPSATVAGLPQQVWSRPELATPISLFSRHFHVPAEMLISSLLVESGSMAGLATNLERMTRLEEYFEPDINRTKETWSKADQMMVVVDAYPRDKQLKSSANAEYTNLVARYRQIVPEADVTKRGDQGSGLGGLRVPSPWNDATTITSTPGTMTWGELRRLLQISDYFPTRISVGMMQTLLSSAKGLMGTLSAMYPDLAAADPALPAAGPWWAAFGVPQPPADISEFMTSWLIVPRNAILLGAVHYREIFIRSNLDTNYDPPRIVACYASGSIYDSSGPWGMGIIAGYLENWWAKAYNASVTFFNNNPTISPAALVRLMR